MTGGLEGEDLGAGDMRRNLGKEAISWVFVQRRLRRWGFGGELGCRDYLAR